MRHSGPAVIVLILIAACAESGSTLLPAEPLRLIDSSAAGILEDSEKSSSTQTAAILESVEADAGWSPDGFAYGGAIIKYTATNAFVAATVISDSGSKTHKRQVSHKALVRAQLAPDIPIVSMSVCTGTIRGEAEGRVWNEQLTARGVHTWGEESGTASDKAGCPRPTSTTSTSSAGGEDSGLTCYTIETDHYWYYPDTGEIEYRYTEAYTWCEKDGSAYM